MLPSSEQLLSRIRSCAAAVLVFAAVAPPIALSQAAPTLTPGTKVRAKATAAGAQWIQGEFVRMTSDTVFIRDPSAADTLRLATSSLTHFQVSRGLHARTGKGALLGLGIGAGTGLLLGLAASAESCTGFCPVEVGPGEILAAAALLGGVGAAIGALIGSASHGERWQRIDPLPKAARLRPVRGGIQIGVALRL